MNEVIYKIRVNRPCRLFIDDEEMMILDENKLTKITLPEGEYLRKVVAIDNKAIYDEAEIELFRASKLDTITLDTTGLEEAKRNALPKDNFQVGDLMYKALEDGSGVAVAKYVDKNITRVVIPEEIVYGHYIYEVKEIGNGAFYGCKSLTSFTIPNSVTSIGHATFVGCSSLTSITIPNSVTSIGKLAFTDCSSLTYIVVEKGNAKYDCRENCNAIIETATNTLIRGCQNTIIPNSVTSIGDLAFFGCSSLTSITIPNSVTSIGKGAFRGCESLTSITIPNSVTSIGGSAFSGCSGLTSIIVEKGNAVYDSQENCNAIIETATNTLIRGCQNTIIPNSVTSIGNYAFYGCFGLTSITIPNGVTSIGKGAFYGCKSLTSFTIPNSVTSIGDWAFIKCFRLTSVTVPSHTEIADNAFPDHTQIIRE